MALRARWEPWRAAAARRALSLGRSLRKVAFGEVDGRLDLRGLPAVSLKVLHVPLVKPLHWRDLDLSDADLGDLFLVRGGTFENCRFDRTDCRGWGLFGGTVRRCSFVRADLRDGMVGKGTVWEDVDFTHADLRRSHSSDGRFQRVRFDHARLFRREFSSDILDECTFAGLVEDCQFGGPDAPPNLIRRVDFSRATLKFARFWNQDLADVVPPAGDDHVVVRNPACVYDRLLEAIDRDQDHPLAWKRLTFEIVREELGCRQKFHSFHLSELSLTEDVDGGRAAAAVLRKLDLGCASR